MSQSPSEKNESPQQPQSAIVAAVLLVIAAVLAIFTYTDVDWGDSAIARVLRQRGRVTIWWNAISRDVRESSVQGGPISNIHPSDYAGPESCRQCHPGKYDSWSQHSHRWMNAMADESTVKGDFSGEATISYLGGEATFYREDGKYLMRLQRGSVQRVYQATQTIGSRFFQYYVGTLLSGPEPPDHPAYRDENVLLFGYWLDYQQWVPVVHVGPEMPDGERPDPFDPPYGTRFVAEYANNCNYCHTTFPLGDMLVRNTPLLGRHAPANLHWLLTDYLREERPEVRLPEANPGSSSMADMKQVFDEMRDAKATEHAATLGISCEACHLGAAQHARNPEVAPKFFPSSPHLFVQTDADTLDYGRTHENVNWICGRCHAGDRPQFAGGMSTWNSTEFSDAVRGSCYSQLRCIDCHDPHETIGKQWSRPPEEDDASCLACHRQFEPAEQRVQHTHHPVDSEGSRCMNCHMPRINEGMQDVVRTHTIFSPTMREPIEQNHPNACNLCHTDKPIDWTLTHLKQWYGASYSEEAIAKNYPRRQRAVAKSWLKSDHESVRLVAGEALIRARDEAALPELIEALDDPYLLNRQFALKGLETWLDLRLSDFGYHFYASPGERRQPLAKIRSHLLSEANSESVQQ